MTAPAIIGGSTGAIAAATTSKEKLKKTAEAFEAVFIRQIMSSMRSSSLGDDMFGSSAGDQFRDMSDARTADNMAAKGTFGIADMLMAQLGKTAAAATTPATDAKT